MVATREYGSRFERARLPRPRPAPGTATRPRRKTTQYGTNDRVGERGGAPPAVRLRRAATAALAGFAAKSMSPSRKTTLFPEPSGRNLTGTKAEKWYQKVVPIRVLPYLETPGTTKRAPIELGGGGVTTGRGAQLGAPYTSAP